MTIKFEQQRAVVDFGDVKIGDTFYHDGDIFVKIEDGLLKQSTGRPMNVVNLSTGATDHFSAVDTVEMLKCELVIKN